MSHSIEPVIQKPFPQAIARFPDLEYGLSTFWEDFERRKQDLLREDRKLRIGVMGQVKAGKSSFLNAFLFGGKEVLPTAATPKTANLAQILHGETHAIEVEYFTLEEWQHLIRLAADPGSHDRAKAAKELVEMIRQRDYDPTDILGRGTERFELSSQAELEGKLNDYASDNGRYMPLVKSLRLFLPDEALRDLEIIDTPGMNDPILSRTDKTRQHMSRMDVVFFLSRASKFLDQADMDLVMDQLPMKGIRDVILVASKFDSALEDAGDSYENLEEATRSIRQDCVKRARKVFDEFLAGEQRLDPEAREVVKKAIPPLFVSSMAKNLVRKELQALNAREKLVLDNLDALWPEFSFTVDDLAGIHGFEVLEGRFADVRARKEATLAAKARALEPSALNEWTQLLTALRDQAVARIGLLTSQDLQAIDKQRAFMARQRHALQAQIAVTVGELGDILSRTRSETVSQIRRDIQRFSDVQAHTGSYEVTDYHEESASVLWNPLSWGSTRTVATSRTVQYQYLEVLDALENVRLFVDEAIGHIETRFNSALERKVVRRQFSNGLLTLFSAQDDFDPELLRAEIERVVCALKLPEVRIDVSTHVTRLGDAFATKVKGEDMSALRRMLAETLRAVFEQVEKAFIAECDGYQQCLDDTRESLYTRLSGNIEEVLTQLEAEFAHKDREIAGYRELVVHVEEELTRPGEFRRLAPSSQVLASHAP